MLWSKAFIHLRLIKKKKIIVVTFWKQAKMLLMRQLQELIDHLNNQSHKLISSCSSTKGFRNQESTVNATLKFKVWDQCMYETHRLRDGAEEMLSRAAYICTTMRKAWRPGVSFFNRGTKNQAHFFHGIQQGSWLCTGYPLFKWHFFFFARTHFLCLLLPLCYLGVIHLVHSSSLSSGFIYVQWCKTIGTP